MKVGSSKPDRFEGWLFKWTNYVNGYQKRWFVLSEGILSYFSTKGDVMTACRGQLVVAASTITSEKSCRFAISNVSGVNYYLRANSEIDCQQWMKALQLAKSTTLQDMLLNDSANTDNVVGSSTDGAGQGLCDIQGMKYIDVAFLNCKQKQNKNHLQNSKTMLAPLKAKFTELEICNKLTSKHGLDILAALDEVMSAENEIASIQKEYPTKVKAANDAAAIFRNTCFAMVTACSEFFEVAKALNDNWECFFDNEDKLTNEPKYDEDAFSDEDDFWDASESVFREQTATTRINNSRIPNSHSESLASYNQTKYREKIPFKPDYKLNLWTVLKNCIGRDLSSLPVPLNFNEPISILQKLSEDFEYSELIEKAAACKDSCEQMTYVAAFSVSTYSTQAYRTGKPFNPMLGETFELDRSDDRGFKLIAEQVSHHPPKAALHAYSTREVVHGGWTFWTDAMPSSSFRGNYLTLKPVGLCHLKFHATGNHYTWNKPTITVNNIILGKFWIDQSGDSNIFNHFTRERCKLTFYPFSYISNNDFREVSGMVTDKNGIERYSLSGTWDKYVKCRNLDPLNKNGHHDTLLWEMEPLHPLSSEMYDFTYFTISLNEWVNGTAPTDSRRRPDQRKMEEAEWDDANALKLELEERQRQRRKSKENDEAEKTKSGLPAIPYQPRWFEKSQCEVTGENIFKYTHEYWECREKQDWSRTIDIFDLSEKGPSLTVQND